MTPLEIIFYNIAGSLIGAGIPVAIAIYLAKDKLSSSAEEVASDMDVDEIMEEGMEALMGGSMEEIDDE